MDQRVEHVFALMNNIYRRSPECAKRQLHLRTYPVPCYERLLVTHCLS